MRVMVWNVWWRFGGNWRRREEGIRATLDAYRPDVLGLVESWSGEGTDQPHSLAAPCGMHATFAPSPFPPQLPYEEKPGIGFGVGLLSRWPFLAVEPHELTGAPGPVALLATLDHPRGPLHVIVGTADGGLVQCRELAALAADHRLDGPHPVLLLADLNASVDRPALTPLLGVMTDTWPLGGGDPGAVTFDSAMPYTPPAADLPDLIDRRIDHVLARPGRPGQPLTVRGAFLAGDRPIGGVYPSDHYAVGVDL